MDARSITLQERGQFQLRFRSLFDAGRGFEFPCDEEGHVNLDALSERARKNYLCARNLVGRDLARPTVELATL